MWVKQCHKLPMTGNGKHTTYKHGDLGDGFMIVLTSSFNHTKRLGCHSGISDGCRSDNLRCGHYKCDVRRMLCPKLL